ncbi:hypothetical protein ACS4JF_25435 [Bacillus thuringiensis]|uniref:hypothetical protein n=1 Tax=Bacillus thuringiensis TaxID=1428 RepID=UPI001FACD919|nr:hypothetical protein [Bacillus thuringiensis]MDM8365840.1 hypothetical protein [Bacillus thuringiensis]HDT6579216.1 hypothetical protein [Bacillus cereus]
MGLYLTIKNALYDQLVAGLTTQSIKADVHKVHYQNIAFFPSLAFELQKRRKVKKGLGVSEVEFTILVWVYSNILDAEDAEEECIELLNVVEKIIESDKTLGGTVAYLSIDDEAEFGQVETGEANFLQGARLPVLIRSKPIPKEV